MSENEELPTELCVDNSRPSFNDIKKLNQKYQNIIDNYNSYNDNIKNVNEDIKKLKGVHHIYIY